MTGIAEELRRRSSKEYVKGRAKEVVVKSGVQVKDRVVGSPMAWTVLGGLAGAGIASLSARWYLAREDRKRYAIESEPEYVPEQPTRAEELRAEAQARVAEYQERAQVKAGELQGKAQAKVGEFQDKAEELQGKAQAKFGELREKAVDLKESAKEKIAGAKESVAGKAQQLKDQAPEQWERGKSKLQRGIDEAPWSIVFASLAAGAAISFLIPLTDPERHAFRQYKSKAAEKLQGVKEQAAEKLEQMAQKADERISQMAEEQEVRPNARGSNLPH